MSKIYEVFENDTQIRFYFYATKKAALLHKKQYLKENPQFDCDIRAMEVKLTKKGIVEELNFLISKICFNEG